MHYEKMPERYALSEKNSWHSMILIWDTAYFITAWQIPSVQLIYEFCMFLQYSNVMVQLMAVILFCKWPSEKWNRIFSWSIWSSTLNWRRHAEWNSSFYVAPISFLCVNLKQCDQFAVTALRTLSVKIVGVAKSTVHVKNQRLLDA